MATTVTTTTATAAPAPKVGSLHIDFATIESDIESVARFLPIIATFFPPLKPAVAIVPVLEGLLKIADQIENAPSGDQATITAIVSKGLHDMGDAVAATAPSKVDPQAPQG